MNRRDILKTISMAAISPITKFIPEYRQDFLGYGEIFKIKRIIDFYLTEVRIEVAAGTTDIIYTGCHFDENCFQKYFIDHYDLKDILYNTDRIYCKERGLYYGVPLKLFGTIFNCTNIKTLGDKKPYPINTVKI